MALSMIAEGFLFFFRTFGLGSGTRKPSRQPRTGCGSKSVWDCVCPRHMYEYAITFDDEGRLPTNILLGTSPRCLKVTLSNFHFLQFGLSLEACKSYFSFNLCDFHVTKSLAHGLTVGTIVAGTTIVCAERKGTPNPLTPSAKHHSAVMFLNREASCCDLLCPPSKAFLAPIVVILVFFNSAVTVIPVSGVTS
ncbi:hypothetical protein PAXINDRAFT_18711 [Paxillus involutus ATCC 200175]|uniref:Uncharacterized protein n=1 Tax=Paxillus involutus ATCC 200175 TaxID=664439 RepID=A0A0C9SYD0_PAXIN|nr:hypothetical protein PAXINDRAFT_18711 [Paxillus involutus ATCC 200175]